MELNPDDYYRIDWDALDKLADADKMAALATIFERVRADIGAERGRMVHQAHTDHGIKKDAAAHLGLSPARFGQIYDQYKENNTMTTTTEPLEAWERGLLEGPPDTRPTAKVDAAYREAEARAGDGWEVAMAKVARDTAWLYDNPDALAHMVRRPQWDTPADTPTGYTIQVRDNVHAEAKKLGLSLYHS